MRLRWWPHTDDAAVASYRLRCLQVIGRLAAEGLDAGVFDPDAAQAPTLLVLSKRYDARSREQAVRLRERGGTQLLLDLCDNHFHVDNAEPRLMQRADELRATIAAMDGVIAASHALAEVVRAECPAQRHVDVIADAAEPPFEPTFAQRLRHPRDELALRQLDAALQRDGIAREQRLLWFGNHGSPGAEGGMADLLRIRAAIEAAHRSQPLSLSVISNSADKFAQLVQGWALPTHYLPWSATTFSRAARLHGAALIPVGLNPFTRCKTNNRVATAFLHGLNVIADAIPSYEEFRDCAALDDWRFALGAYLGDLPRRDADVRAGLRLVNERYSLAAIAARWRECLQQAAARAPSTTDHP